MIVGKPHKEQMYHLEHLSMRSHEVVLHSITNLELIEPENRKNKARNKHIQNKNFNSINLISVLIMWCAGHKYTWGDQLPKHDTNSIKSYQLLIGYWNMVITKFICFWQAIFLYGVPQLSCKLVIIFYPIETGLLNVNFHPWVFLAFALIVSLGWTQIAIRRIKQFRYIHCSNLSFQKEIFVCVVWTKT